jgi:hypothetical protein
VASLAQAGIAIAEGDYKGALIAAVGAVPGGKLVGGAVKATAKALDKIADGAKVVDKLRDVASAAKSVNKALGPCGLCFMPGTEVSTPDGPVKIEELRVGDKVTTTNVAKDKPDGWTEVDPKRWRVVKLLMPDPKGSEDVYELELLRSLKWIREVGAAPRRWIEIGLPEIGLTGLAKAVAITACPKIKVGPGRVVLMTVTHLDQGVMEIEFAGLKNALEPTASHPLFSEDRNDWVAAGQLRVGERIRTKAETARIEAIRWKRGEHRVYNIEVEADHSYFVSRLELLSHNSGACGASKGGTLIRFGQKAETAKELGEQAAKAEAKGFGHGVSTKLEKRVSGSDKMHKSALKSEVEKVFEVKQTGRDPKHHTVILPKPVTQEVAGKFNKVFKPLE